MTAYFFYIFLTFSTPAGVEEQAVLQTIASTMEECTKLRHRLWWERFMKLPDGVSTNWVSACLEVHNVEYTWGKY
jgi:hypothetical protein